jgi:hypothetical protein
MAVSNQDTLFFRKEKTDISGAMTVVGKKRKSWGAGSNPGCPCDH